MMHYKDYACIWKGPSKVLVAETKNLKDECHFNHAVINKVVLPKESSRNHVNGCARFALYKIMKKKKVNPAHLIWSYLTSFLEKPTSYLLYGSLITAILDKK